MKNIILLLMWLSFSFAQNAHQPAIQYSKKNFYTSYIHVKASCYNNHTSRIVANRSGMIGSLAFFLEDKISEKIDISELRKIPYLDLLDVFQIKEENLIPSISRYYEAYIKYEYSDLLVRELLHRFTKYKMVKKLSPEILLVPVLKKGKVLDFHCSEMIKPWYSKLNYLDKLKIAIASNNEREIIQNNISNNFSVFEKDMADLIDYQNFHSIIFIINEFFVDEDSNYNLHSRFVTFYRNDRESDVSYIFNPKLNVKNESKDNIFKAPLDIVSDSHNIIEDENRQYFPIDKVKQILLLQSKSLISKNQAKYLARDTYLNEARKLKFLVERHFGNNRKNMIDKLTKLGKVESKKTNPEGDVFVILTNLDDISIARRLYLSNLTYYVADFSEYMHLIMLPSQTSQYIR